MATKSSLAHNNKSVTRIQFDRAGWPINPATGRPYSRDEIVTNPAIPYPQDIDTSSPYWQRRSQAQLTAEKAKLQKKQQKRRRSAARRKTFQSAASALSGAELQERERAGATVELIERTNGDTILMNLLPGIRLVA